jgi:hypothetical protein
MAKESWPSGSSLGRLHGGRDRCTRGEPCVLAPHGGSGLLAPADGGLILLYLAGRDAAALTQRQTMLLCPGPDIT